MTEKKSIDSIRLEERSRYEHRLILDHFRQRQIETLTDVILLPSGSVGACYPAEPISPPWGDARPRSKGERPI